MKLQCKLLLLLIMASALSMAINAQNHMPLMTTLYGEFGGDEFGAGMVSMDYNGDGYDDLIVAAKYWNDTGVLGAYYPGKLYFYWGSPEGLSDSPDFVIEGQTHRQIAPFMVNAGDMDGDGIDDLAITYSTDVPWGTYKSIAIFLGRTNPQIAPDYVSTIPYTSVRPLYLGDVNGDGKSDLAFFGWHLSQRYSYFTYIWTDLETDPILFMDGAVYGSPIYLGGVGDVNGDGYDDAYLAFPSDPANITIHGVMLRYGDTSASLSDSLLLIDSYEDSVPRCSPLGDINGDGFTDFMGFTVWPNHYIWFGSAEMDSIPGLALDLTTNEHDMRSFRRPNTEYACYGDLNGDGYDDFVCSDHYANGYNGQAGLWLGGPNVNASVDLIFEPPLDWQLRNFGYAKTIGDYNGDGYDDLALSCVRWRTGAFLDPGRIYVFAGNAQLQDTTVATDDPVAPPASVEDWSINVYPNPYSFGFGTLNIELAGESFAKSGSYSYQLFNIRGQKVQEGQISSEDLSQRNFSLALDGFSAGIYQISLLFGGKSIQSKKLVVY